MATSTAPAMLALLFSDFTTAFSSSGIQVLYGDDSRHAERQNVVLSGSVDFDEDAWKNLGGLKREEIYRLDGFVQSRNPGDSTQAATESAWALAATVETQVRSLISGAGLASVSAALDAAFPDKSAQMTKIDFEPKGGRAFAIDDGMAYQIDFAVKVTARI